MRFKVPLFFLMFASAGSGFISLALGLRILASPFVMPLEISFDVLMVSGLIIFGGLIASIAGFLLLRWSFNCLKDLFSAPVSIRGQVSARRIVEYSNKGSGALDANSVPSTHYVRIGSEEFEVPASDYEKAIEGQMVEVTYLPNTRTVEAVTPVCPAWLTPTVAAVAHSIVVNDDWSALPILADALEEAGCTDIDMLQPCREPNNNQDGFAVAEMIVRTLAAFGGKQSAH